MSERKVLQDQRAAENTLSTNMQSELEKNYTVSFRDGKRVDATEIIVKKLLKSSNTGSRQTDRPKAEHLKASRLACLIFEVKISSLFSSVWKGYFHSMSL